MSNRKVVVYEWRKRDDGKCYEKVPIGNGIFHGFGVDFEEFEAGPGNYSTAIVELPDGSIKNVHVEMIVFND
jgi:hypothetical protein